MAKINPLTVAFNRISWMAANPASVHPGMCVRLEAMRPGFRLWQNP